MCGDWRLRTSGVVYKPLAGVRAAVRGRVDNLSFTTNRPHRPHRQRLPRGMNPHSQSPVTAGRRAAHRRLIRAAAIADAAGTLAAPGAVLIEDGRIVASGSPQSIGSAGDAGDAMEEVLPGEIVIPALVNAHAHLDLTHMGPQPQTGDFAAWVDRVRSGRARSPEAIAASVREGIRLSRAGGTAIVGDIAGVRSIVPTQTLRDAGMAAVSYLEVFGIGNTQAATIEFLKAATASQPGIDAGVRFGLQPHAPYSCGPDVYRAVAAMGLPLSTHLAETRDELEFVASATGPLADMLGRIGVWDDSITGFGRHSIDHITNLLGDHPLLAAHLNYLDDRHVELLARRKITVAYCPRASAYFGHVNHRYRDMLAAGVNVALGTDSILCLGTADRISVLDEMRLLHRRDATDPMTLLAMTTINGARVLGTRESLVTLKPGESAGLLALPVGDAPTSAHEAMVQAMKRDDPPRWVLGPIAGRNEWFQ